MSENRLDREAIAPERLPLFKVLRRGARRIPPSPFQDAAHPATEGVSGTLWKLLRGGPSSFSAADAHHVMPET